MGERPGDSGDAGGGRSGRWAIGLAALAALVLGYCSLRAPDPPIPVVPATGVAAPVPGVGSLLPVAASLAARSLPNDCADGADSGKANPADPVRREREDARALEAIAGELAGHAAPADRVLAQYVGLVNSLATAHARFVQGHPECDRDPACGPSEAAAEDAALTQAVAPYRDTLVRIAASSNDVGAYALAYMACTMGYPRGGTGACAQLSARQWAQMEPDNAQPWLLVADEADSQAAPALVADALYRAAEARRSDLHWDIFAHMLDTDALHGQSTAVRTEVTFTAMTMALSGHFARMAPVMSHCTATALVDPNRRQVCDDLARLFTERSDSVLALAVGISLGERLGWPAERLDALRNQRAAFLQLASERVGVDFFSCESLAKQREWIGQSLRYGEMGAMRRVLAASGQSVTDLARRRLSGTDDRARPSPSSPTPHPGGSPR